MSLKTLEEFGQEYWSKSFEGRFETWADFLASRLDTSKGEAEEKILEVRTLPLIDADRKASPRFEAAARLLYEASLPCPHHNRRHGPTLASGSLILKLSGANCLKQTKMWDNSLRKLYGNVGVVLLQLKLTESNPLSDSMQVVEKEFSEYDIRKGIKIPRHNESHSKFANGKTARCVGYAYGDGQLYSKFPILGLYGRMVDCKLYPIIQIDFDEVFNYWQEIYMEPKKEAVREVVKPQLKAKFSSYFRPVLLYNSRAIWKCFRNIGFPIRGEEKHLPPQLFREPSTVKREFVRGLIATGSYFNDGRIWFSDRSQSIIEDYDKLLTDIRIECSSPYKPKSDSRTHCLTIYADSTRRLCEQGYCSLNPWVQSKMDEFYLSKG